MEIKCSSKEIQVHSPSMTIPCSIKVTIIEALHEPTAEASIIRFPCRNSLACFCESDVQVVFCKNDAISEISLLRVEIFLTIGAGA